MNHRLIEIAHELGLGTISNGNWVITHHLQISTTISNPVDHKFTNFMAHSSSDTAQKLSLGSFAWVRSVSSCTFRFGSVLRMKCGTVALIYVAICGKRLNTIEHFTG